MQRPFVKPRHAEPRSPDWGRRADQSWCSQPRTGTVAAHIHTQTRTQRASSVLLASVMALQLTACSAPPSKPSSPAQAQGQAQNQNAARALRRGDAASALASYQAALAAAESVEDFESSAVALLNLATVHSQLGQNEAALARVERILAQPALFSVNAQAQAAARKALLLLDQDQIEQALTWAERSLLLCPSACALAPAMNNLRAHVALGRGELARATSLALQAAEQAAAAGLQAEQANGQRLAGRALSQQGQHEPAAQLLAQALLLDQALGLPDRIASDLQYAAQNEQRRGQLAAAKAYLERAWVVSQAAGHTARAAALRQQLQSMADTASR